MRAPRITRRITAPVLPVDNETTRVSGPTTWIWTPGEVPPNVTPAPFRDVWADDPDRTTRLGGAA